MANDPINVIDPLGLQGVAGLACEYAPPIMEWGSSKTGAAWAAVAAAATSLGHGII